MATGTGTTAMRQTEVILDKLMKLKEVVSEVDRFSAELNGDGTDEDTCDRPTAAGSLGRIEMVVDEITRTAVDAMNRLEKV
jgi:hypothetical protein